MDIRKLISPCSAECREAWASALGACNAVHVLLHQEKEEEIRSYSFVWVAKFSLVRLMLSCLRDQHLVTEGFRIFVLRYFCRFFSIFSSMMVLSTAVVAKVILFIALTLLLSETSLFLILEFCSALRQICKRKSLTVCSIKFSFLFSRSYWNQRLL